MIEMRTDSISSRTENAMKNNKKSMRRSGSKTALRKTFHQAGMRLTRQRLAIYRELMGRYDHPDVEMLYQAVKPRIPQISLFTVYRTMNALENAGMVWRVATWKGHARYDGNVRTHAHFLCETCGKLVDLMDDLGGSMQAFTGLKGTVNRIEVKLTGECEDCAGQRELEQQDA